METCFDIPTQENFIYLFQQLTTSSELTPEQVTSFLLPLLQKIESLPILLSICQNQTGTIQEYGFIFLNRLVSELQPGSLDEQFVDQSLQMLFQLFVTNTSHISKMILEIIWRLSKLYNSSIRITEFFNILFNSNDLFHSIQIALLVLDQGTENFEQLILLSGQCLQHIEDPFFLTNTLTFCFMLIQRREQLSGSFEVLCN